MSKGEFMTTTGSMGMSRRHFIRLAALMGASATAASLVGCDSGSSDTSEGSEKDFELADWDSVLAAARGSEVSLYQYGGYSKMNTWLNTTVAAALKASANITLDYTQVSNTLDTVTVIGSEMQAGIDQGSVDFMWVNGENFYSLKNNGYLYGPVLTALPAHQYLDPENPNNTIDCGVETEGLEVPYNSWYDIFWANTDVISESSFPTNASSFLILCKDNPGKFTYPTPGDFTGTFCISTLIAAAIGQDEWMKVAHTLDFTKDELRKIVEPGLSYLRDLNPYLWQKGETFPSDSGTVDQMYADGELVIEFGCEMPQSKMDDGVFPSSTRPFILKSGVIADVWYLAIPINAAHKAAALVALNEIMGPDIQLTQFKELGYYPVCDMNRLSDEQRASFDEVVLGPGMMDVDKMAPYGIPQASGANITLLEELWLEEVVGKYN
jgi:putative spermidine/putrescine transport system substrate-binding protein